MKESLLNEDYYDKRSGFTRRKSTLPRTPFRMASDLAKQYTSLSQKMGTSTHTALYILYVGWFVLCVPTIVVHVFLNQGYVVDTTYTIIWGWLVFSYTWQFVEGSITFKNHFDTFCLHRPSSDTGNIVYPPATAIIVAYLPNEADIIMDTLAQFRAMHYDGEMQVILAYNTPKILAVEHDIQALQKTWPEFTAVKVVGSTSKCDNINAVLSSIKGQFVGLFDSDHIPMPGSFERAWRDIQGGSDVVQGRTKINPKYCQTFLDKVIAAEFEVRHGIEHGSRKFVYNYAVFGGSNGFWRTEVLQFIGMDPNMLTEDIDSSIRAMSYGHKITYDHHLISLEQPPPGFNALLKQRLRWSQGWYQVSWRSVGSIFLTDFLNLRQKIGFHWMIKMMMPCQILVLHLQSFLLVCLSAKYGFVAVLCLSSFWAVPQLLFLLFFAELPVSWKGMYAVMMLPLMAFFIFVDMIGQVRLMIGYSTWHVTTRKKVDKEDSDFTRGAPLSPGTFRYSPSSVMLDRSMSGMDGSYNSMTDLKV